MVYFVNTTATAESKKSITSGIGSQVEFTQVCDAQLTFFNSPKYKQQTLKLSNTVSLKLSQYLSTYKSRFGTKVATNVICQRLLGSKYSGSEQEWGDFIQQAITGMQSSGGQHMRLELMGEKTKQFKQQIANKEYKLFGEFNGSMQAIYNVAILDKVHNTVYTISVSGNDKGEKAINEEFLRIIKSFKLSNENTD